MPPVENEKTVSGTWASTFPENQESEADSLLFMKRFLYVGFSQITYMRELLPRDCFKKRKCDKLRLQVFDTTVTEAFEVADQLRAVCETLDKGYLRGLHLNIFDEKRTCDEVIEVYKMGFSYGNDEDRPSISFSSNNMDRAEIKYEGKEALKEQTRALLVKIHNITNHLAALPATTRWSFYAIYDDKRVPKEYQARTFEHRSGPYLLAHDAHCVNIGQASPNHHAFLLRVVSVYIVNSLEFSDMIEEEMRQIKNGWRVDSDDSSSKDGMIVMESEEKEKQASHRKTQSPKKKSENEMSASASELNEMPHTMCAGVTPLRTISQNPTAAQKEKEMKRKRLEEEEIGASGSLKRKEKKRKESTPGDQFDASLTMNGKKEGEIEEKKKEMSHDDLEELGGEEEKKKSLLMGDVHLPIDDAAAAAALDKDATIPAEGSAAKIIDAIESGDHGDDLEAEDDSREKEMKGGDSEEKRCDQDVACPYRALRPKSIRKHREFHMVIFKYRCKSCSFSTPEECHLTEHERQHKAVDVMKGGVAGKKKKTTTNDQNGPQLKKIAQKPNGDRELDDIHQRIREKVDGMKEMMVQEVIKQITADVLAKAASSKN